MGLFWREKRFFGYFLLNFPSIHVDDMVEDTRAKAICG
jgi:hypothetical protein